MLLLLLWTSNRSIANQKRQWVACGLDAVESCHSSPILDVLQIGEMMAEFPLDPQLAKMLVTSPDFK